jgi:preprotein translocase subunit SecD
MIHIPTWKIVLTVLVSVLSLVYAAPNLMGPGFRDWAQTSLPSWMPGKTVSLGLDLRGGSHLLLQADMDGVIRQRTEDLVGAMRPELREKKIAYQNIGTIPNGVKVTVSSESDVSEAKSILRRLDENLVVEEKGAGLIEATFGDAALKTIRDQTIGQSIEIVSRRVNESGTKEPVIQRQGEDRILLQMPGVENPERIKQLLGKTAKLTFHLVSLEDGASDARKVPMRDNPAEQIAIKRRPLLTGDMLSNAQPSFQEGAPVVSFRLNGLGARRFCDVTTQNVGKPFAVMLDNEIITAPRINEPICGGSAVISGSFTVQESSDMALLLRAGALPTTLTIVEERSVGPTLGSDSIEAGTMASLIAFVLVVGFMILSYGLFGGYASIALFVNMAMIIALLSLLQATLTLPGIAGIVLTMGMAVDANVLIFERMREEIRMGRSLLAAIDTGYEKAMASIIDSNLTTLISGIILYAVGTGPIKGFAVTMSIGIVTSLFSAIMLTRLMLITWLKIKKPKTLPL